MASLVSLIFALEVDGAPVLTFEAGSAREARELCKEEWLRGDLTELMSNGSRLCGPDDVFRGRAQRVASTLSAR